MPRKQNDWTKNETCASKMSSTVKKEALYAEVLAAGSFPDVSEADALTENSSLNLLAAVAGRL